MSNTAAERHQEKAKKQGKKLGFFARIVLFLRQVVAELKKVVVPTRQELVRYTLVVIVFLLVIMAIVWVLDTLFGLASGWVFGRGA